MDRPWHRTGLIGKAVKSRLGSATVCGRQTGSNASLQALLITTMIDDGPSIFREPGDLPGTVELYSAPNRKVPHDALRSR